METEFSGEPLSDEKQTKILNEIESVIRSKNLEYTAVTCDVCNNPIRLSDEDATGNFIFTKSIEGWQSNADTTVRRVLCKTHTPSARELLAKLKSNSVLPLHGEIVVATVTMPKDTVQITHIEYANDRNTL